MAVYVDALMHHGWRPSWARGKVVKSCHMVADSLEELHAMANAIGMKRSWFQAKKSCPHYDLTDKRRAAAVKHGAVHLDRRAFVLKIREIRGS